MYAIIPNSGPLCGSLQPLTSVQEDKQMKEILNLNYGSMFLALLIMLFFPVKHKKYPITKEKRRGANSISTQVEVPFVSSPQIKLRSSQQTAVIELLGSYLGLVFVPTQYFPV